MNIDITITNVIIVLATLIVSITLHEAMHAYTSHWLGDDTAHEAGRVSLNPLRHVDPYMTLLLPLVTLLLFHAPLLAAKPVPFNPNRVKWDEYGAALVGLAGPFTNVVLAVIGAGILHLVGLSGSPLVLHILITFVQINVAIFVFNMLPLPPLDGSRLLYALVPESVQEVMASMERYGIMIIFALIVAVPAFGDMLLNINSAILRVLL